MNYESLRYVYHSSGRTDAITLLLLHGTGGNEHDLLPLAKSFGDQNVLSVRGNVLENGAPRFFRRLGMGVFDEEDLQFRTHELVHFLRETASKEDFIAENVVALGYSNGANIAGAVLMLYPELLAGAILFRPMQPLVNPPDFRTTRQQPIFFSSGKNDPTVDSAATDRYVQLLQAGGFRVSRHDLNAGHSLTQADVTLAAEWFEKHYGK